MRPFLALLLASGALAPLGAHAQSSDVEALERQLAAMQAEIARLTEEVTELKARAASQEAVPAATPAPAPAPANATVEWKAAPEISEEGGWSFKPRGRLQVDSATIEAPDGIPGNSLGTATELRRAYLGVDGTLPGNFGYRIEADLADSSVTLTDVYLTYE